MQGKLEKFWRKYSADLENYEVFDFGVDKKTSEKLKDLILTGKKKATTGLWKEGTALPHVGSKAIILDYHKDPFAIIEYTQIFSVSFKEITEEYALLEGENDSLEEWRVEHTIVFTQWLAAENREFTEDTQVVGHVFNLVYPLTN